MAASNWELRLLHDMAVYTLCQGLTATNRAKSYRQAWNHWNYVN